jgi:hypothetical protein
MARPHHIEGVAARARAGRIREGSAERDAEESTQLYPCPWREADIWRLRTSERGHVGQNRLHLRSAESSRTVSEVGLQVSQESRRRGEHELPV